MERRPTIAHGFNRGLFSSAPLALNFAAMRTLDKMKIQNKIRNMKQSRRHLLVLSKSKILIAACSLACIVVVTGFVIGCSQQTREISSEIVNPPILEFENVLQYKLELNPKTKIPETISGVCGRSAFCVTGINTRTNGNTLVVLVRIDLFKGKTGSFSYALKLNDDIKYLKFGTKEHLLWQRE